MLKIEHLKKSYENFSLDCSLEVKKGHVTGLIGQNGAGKSTTFKAILGLISFDSGTMLEPGGIDHSESSRNNQSELIRNSQCTCLAN